MKTSQLAVLAMLPIALPIVACSSGDATNGGPPATASSGSSSTISSGGTSSSGSSGGSSSGDMGGSSSSSGAGSSGGSSSNSSGSSGGDDGGTSSDAAASSSSGGGSSSGGTGGAPYGDANFVSLFNGTDLTGWYYHAGSWDVMDNAIHSTAAGARGQIITKDDYGDFRLIVTAKLLMMHADNHVPCTLVWGGRPAAMGSDLGNALGAIQVQIPNADMWDYRAAKNNNPIGGLAMRIAPGTNDRYMFGTCEVLATMATGQIRAACCQNPDLAGDVPCKGVEMVVFKDPTAARKGPIGLQVHTAGNQYEYKHIYVETPVADPTVLVTTK